MKKDFNYVYITTNILNGKQYVGSHSTNTVDDGYLGSGRYFLKALKKEGKENFKREILQECADILEARELEGSYIEKYNTLCPNGYNLSPKGGIGFKGANHSEHTKKKQSKWQKGKTYEELYGPEKAAKMKEKQRQRKLGTTTKRKGKGFKKEFIEKYGKEEGLKRFEEFIEKQRNKKLGTTHKPLREQMVEKYGSEEGTKKYEEYKKTNKYFINAGKNHPNFGKKRSQDINNKVSLSNKLNFYIRLDKQIVLKIQEMYNEKNKITEISKQTKYHLNKVKRIIQEKLWEKYEN
jgi:group I intron endonuclease